VIDGLAGFCRIMYQSHTRLKFVWMAHNAASARRQPWRSFITGLSLLLSVREIGERVISDRITSMNNTRQQLPQHQQQRRRRRADMSLVTHTGELKLSNP